MNYKLVFGLMALVVLVSGCCCTSPSKDSGSSTGVVEQTTPKKPTTTLPETISSRSIDDLSPDWCSNDMTDLKRADSFNQYRGKLIQWTGTVEEVSDYGGSYTVLVKHCPSSFSSDIKVYLKASEKSKALDLKKDQSITYKARLTDWSALFGLEAREGEIV